MREQDELIKTPLLGHDPPSPRGTRVRRGDLRGLFMRGLNSLLRSPSDLRPLRPVALCPGLSGPAFVGAGSEPGAKKNPNGLDDVEVFQKE